MAAKPLVIKAYELAVAAQAEGGWLEIPGPKTNAKIRNVLRAVDGLGNPEMLDDSTTSWCSCLINYWIQKAGGKGTRSAGARSWLRWGKRIEKPVEGCIVVFKRGKEPWMGHVAFFKEIVGDKVRCLGGNQGNDFNYSRYSVNDVLGFFVSLDF